MTLVVTGTYIAFDDILKRTISRVIFTLRSAFAEVPVPTVIACVTVQPKCRDIILIDVHQNNVITFSSVSALLCVIRATRTALSIASGSDSKINKYRVTKLDKETPSRKYSYLYG